MAIIGIILGVIAIGLFVWLYTWYRDQEMNIGLLESELEGAKHAYEALISDLNNYLIFYLNYMKVLLDSQLFHIIL